MAKDYSNAKAEEQMQKGEISPSELQAWNDKMNQMNLKKIYMKIGKNMIILNQAEIKQNKVMMIK